MKKQWQRLWKNYVFQLLAKFGQIIYNHSVIYLCARGTNDRQRRNRKTRQT